MPTIGHDSWFCRGDVAGVLAAAVAGAVAVPALWAVRFALAEAGRRAMLAYWLALLAVSLPAMHVLASSRQLPTIIIRKVPGSRSHGVYLLVSGLWGCGLVQEGLLD